MAPPIWHMTFFIIVRFYWKLLLGVLGSEIMNFCQNPWIRNGGSKMADEFSDYDPIQFKIGV